MTWWLMVILLLTPVLRAQATDGEAPVLDEHQQRDLKLLLSVVREPKMESGARREAVASLLQRRWPQAIEALLADLAPGGEASTQKVIARVLAGAEGELPAEFAPALLALLESADSAVGEDLAAALGRFASPVVTQRLVALVTNREAPLPRRISAATALGHHRSLYVAGVLARLLEGDEPDLLRRAVAAALTNLTGLDQFADSAQAWQQWWSAHQEMGEQAWLELLLRNFAQRTRTLAADRQAVLNRLVEAQRQLYLVTDRADRPALLVRLLADPLQPLRRLAIDLAVQRLIDQEKIEGDLLTALRGSLADSNPSIREGAARVLRDVRDAEAAATIGKLIATERTASVLRAYLVMLADLPQAAAVDRQVALLGDAELRADAAGSLARAWSTRMLTPAQIAEVRRQLEAQAWGDVPPPPRVIELMGRVGDDAQWARIAGWLDSADEPVRTAAAGAWAESDRPLAPLIERANTLALQQIVIAAASRRGSDGATLLAMVKHKPQAVQLVEAWTNALVAMAGRAPRDAVRQAVALLGGQAEPPALREKMLSAAISRPTPLSADGVEPAPAAEPVSSALLLDRAAVYLQLDQPRQALADLRAVRSNRDSLDPPARAQVDSMYEQALLASGEFEEFFQEATRKLEALASAEAQVRSEATHAVAASALNAARAAVNVGQRDQARTLVLRLKTWANGRLSSTATQVVEELLQQLAAPPPTTPGPTGPAATPSAAAAPAVPASPSAAAPDNSPPTP